MRIPVFFVVAFAYTAQGHAQSGDVGIGTTAPTDQLHTTGTVRLQNYAGTGTRVVQIDASGRLAISGNGPTFKASPTAGIPDNGCTSGTPLISNLTVSGLPTSVPSGKISVRVNITHPSSQQLKIFLFSPGNAQLMRLSNGAGAGANYTNTVFTDEAPGFISNGSSPFTGKYKPSGGQSSSCGLTPWISTFAEFNGGTINPNGTWQLRVFDDQAALGGVLQSWEISFSGPESFTSNEQANYIPKFSGGNFQPSNFYEHPSTGNIGLNTTAPSYPLTLAGSGNGYVHDDATSGVAMGTFTNNFGGWIRTLTADRLLFNTGSTGGPEMMLDTAGRLGVGVGLLAQRRLDVLGGSRLATDNNLLSAIDAENINSLAYGQNVDINFKNGTFYTGRIRTSGTANNAASLSLFTYASTDSGNLKERLTIDDAGNVGINTATNEPNKVLTVNGSIKMADGNQAAGKVMTSDAAGKGSWSTPAPPPGYNTGFLAGIANGAFGTYSFNNFIQTVPFTSTCFECFSDGSTFSNIQNAYVANGNGVYTFHVSLPFYVDHNGAAYTATQNNSAIIVSLKVYRPSDNTSHGFTGWNRQYAIGEAIKDVATFSQTIKLQAGDRVSVEFYQFHVVGQAGQPAWLNFYYEDLGGHFSGVRNY